MGSDNSRLRVNLGVLQERVERACEKSARPRSSVRLIAITKTHPVETIQELIDLGVNNIGENRVQEIEEKVPLLRGDFTVHMVGHLQTNKVAHLIPHVKWIQSIDREKLISRIEFCHKETSKLSALVEVNTSKEAAKSGCMPQECRALCERVAASKAMEFCGLMTIGPLNGSESEVRESFSSLRRLSETCCDLAPAMELSMGMSGDFEVAIEEGATLVRIGTALFGSRNKK